MNAPRATAPATTTRILDGAAFRIAAWMLAVALVVLPVVAVVNGWIGAQRWPLRTLRVEGKLQRVDPARLQKALLPYARRGFFAVRLDEAQAAVARLPWVEQYPGQIEVFMMGRGINLFNLVLYDKKFAHEDRQEWIEWAGRLEGELRALLER